MSTKLKSVQWISASQGPSLPQPPRVDKFLSTNQSRTSPVQPCKWTLWLPQFALWNARELAKLDKLAVVRADSSCPLLQSTSDRALLLVFAMAFSDRAPSEADMSFKLAAITTAGTFVLFNSFGTPIFKKQTPYDLRSLEILGEMMVTGGADGIVRCWTQSDGEEMLWTDAQVKDVSDVVTTLRAIHDGEYLLAGTAAGKICLWRVKYNR